MPVDYTLTPVSCWSCPQTFSDLITMQAHHLAVHERALYGVPVPVWLARDVTPLVRATVDADCPVCQHTRGLLTPFCPRCGPTCAACATPQVRWVLTPQADGTTAVQVQEGTPTAPTARRMWQVGVEGDRYNAHAENGVCRTAGCVPVDEETQS